MSTITEDKTVTLTGSALEAIIECRTLIANAHSWKQCADLSYEEAMKDNGENGRRILEERVKKVAEMEESFYINFLSMITMGFGNEIRIMRDSEACFFFNFDSGFHGGLIFHRDHSLSKPGEPLTIGTWSLHS